MLIKVPAFIVMRILIHGNLSQIFFNLNEKVDVMKTLIVCFVCLLFVGCITPNQNDLRPETDAEITACKKRVDKLQKELNEKKDNSGVTIFDE